MANAEINQLRGYLLLEHLGYIMIPCNRMVVMMVVEMEKKWQTGWPLKYASIHLIQCKEDTYIYPTELLEGSNHQDGILHSQKHYNKGKLPAVQHWLFQRKSHGLEDAKNQRIQLLSWLSQKNQSSLQHCLLYGLSSSYTAAICHSSCPSYKIHTNACISQNLSLMRNLLQRKINVIFRFSALKV